MRKSLILKELQDNNIDINSINAIVARGGLLPPVKSGAYLINEDMIDRLKNRPVIEHVSNLAAIIAYEIGKLVNIESYIYDSIFTNLPISYAIIAAKLDTCSITGLFFNLSIISSLIKYAPDFTGGSNPPLATMAFIEFISILLSWSSFKIRLFLILTVLLLLSWGISAQNHFDIVVVGGNPGGIMAAIEIGRAHV